MIATEREASRLARTTTPAAATPTAIALDRRDQNSVGKDGEPAVHDQVVQAVHRIDVPEHPPQFGHRPGRCRNRGRLSNHNDGRAPPAMLTIVVITAIQTASNVRARGGRLDTAISPIAGACPGMWSR